MLQKRLGGAREHQLALEGSHPPRQEQLREFHREQLRESAAQSSDQPGDHPVTADPGDGLRQDVLLPGDADTIARRMLSEARSIQLARILVRSDSAGASH